MLKSKIHRATVTHADLHYDGSLTLDRDLMRAADLVEYEHIHVWNVTRGTRLQTYVMEGEPKSGVVCVNGAAAHLAKPGNLIIIAAFTMIENGSRHQPKIVLVNADNHIHEVISTETPGPAS